MATTTLNTRIQLKYDTYENWTANNPVLLAGEVAVTTVQYAQAPVSQVPAILFKVGDGTNNFNTLNWASAIAADVYPWAKASVKPTYQASEIEGLEDYISGQIDDTDTQYQIIASGTNGIQLQSRPKTGGAWSDVGSPITITYTLETGTTNGTVSFNGTEVAVKGLGGAAYTESSAYDAAGTAAGVQTAVIGTSGDQSSAITIYGTRKYAAEQATAAQTAATTAANSYTDGQITQAKTDLIGTGDATSTTIKGAVAESKTYADTQIAAKGVPSTEGVPTDYLLSPAGWVAPPSGGGGTWELIQDITLDEDVKSIKIEKNSAEMPFSFDEIYINTNATNVAEQTVATLVMFKINSKNTYFIGTSSPMLFNGGKNGKTGRNWAWVRSINPLIVMTGSWIETNTASNKTVYCYQPNDINMDAQGPAAILNPYSVGEKISGIEIAGAMSTSFFSAGSRFLVYGR